MARNLFSKLNLEDASTTEVEVLDPTDPGKDELVVDLSNNMGELQDQVATIEEAEELIADIDASIASDRAALLNETNNGATPAGDEPSASTDGDAGIPEVAEAVSGDIEIKSLEASQEELKSFYRRAGMSREQISRESFSTVSLSREAILKEKEGLRNTIAKGLAHVGNAIGGILATVVRQVSGIFQSFKTDKLEQLREELKNGTRNAKTELTTSEVNKIVSTFNFTPFCNELGGDFKDLIEYAKAVIGQLDESNTAAISNQLLDIFKGVTSTKFNFNIKKDKAITTLLKKSNADFDMDPDANTYLLGFIINPFVQNPRVCSLTINTRGIDLHVDTFKSKDYYDVKPTTNKDLINLLTVFIDLADVIKKVARSAKWKALVAEAGVAGGIGASVAAGHAGSTGYKVAVSNIVSAIINRNQNLVKVSPQELLDSLKGTINDKIITASWTIGTVYTFLASYGRLLTAGAQALGNTGHALSVLDSKLARIVDLMTDVNKQ